MRTQLLMPILLSAAQKIGLNILVEPTRGMYGVILFDSGKKYYIKDINLNLNLTVSASLAKNKAATSFFLEQFGYPVPEFTMVCSDEKCARIKSNDTVQEGLNFSRKIGFPVILKPNNMSQGNLVFKANDEDEYFRFAAEILKYCNTAQVQKFYCGNDYRIVVLGKKVLSAYQRVPFYVVGDGNASISELISKKQQLFVCSGRDTKLKDTDMRLAYKLLQQGLSLRSILPSGKKVFLQDISNLSAGGETIELTDKIHYSFAKLALMIARDMNLTLCGIDIITNDITQENDGQYTIIEINSSPGLDNYAYEGLEQEAYVESLYQDILLYIKDSYSPNNISP
jgi:D-alanine-D-alanine ligase-like ATP-grasp enzyme